MTELSFLIELLLNHDLPLSTKNLVANRIREVERDLVSAKDKFPAPLPQRVNAAPGIQQAPSTLALMAKHGDIPGDAVIGLEVAPVIPVEQVAQTPATAAAMNSRNEAINQALSGKIDKVSGRPRKF